MGGRGFGRPPPYFEGERGTEPCPCILGGRSFWRYFIYIYIIIFSAQSLVPLYAEWPLGQPCSRRCNGGPSATGVWAKLPPHSATSKQKHRCGSRGTFFVSATPLNLRGALTGLPGSGPRGVGPSPRPGGAVPAAVGGGGLRNDQPGGAQRPPPAAVPLCPAPVLPTSPRRESAPPSGGSVQNGSGIRFLLCRKQPNWGPLSTSQSGVGFPGTGENRPRFRFWVPKVCELLPTAWALFSSQTLAPPCGRHGGRLFRRGGRNASPAPGPAPPTRRSSTSPTWPSAGTPAAAGWPAGCWRRARRCAPAGATRWPGAGLPSFSWAKGKGSHA